MKSILVTMIISLLLLKPNGGESKPVEDYSGFTYRGQEYALEDLGFLPGSQIKPVRGWYINGYHIIPEEDILDNLEFDYTTVLKRRCQEKIFGMNQTGENRSGQSYNRRRNRT